MSETEPHTLEHDESDRPTPGAGDHGSGSGVTAGAGVPAKPVVWDPFGLRFLVIGWCLWLLVSWSISLTLGATVHAVRWVVFSAVFGLMAVWPAYRLGQQPVAVSAGRRTDGAGFGALATLLDWVFLVVIFQVVIWPLMLVGGWSFRQALFLDGAILSWSLLTGLLLALGRARPGQAARVVMMVLCVMLLIGEPVLTAVPSVSGWWESAAGEGGRSDLMRVSPVQALWELTTTRQPYDPSRWAVTIFSTAFAAAIGWALLGLMSLMRWGRRQRDTRYRMA
ncbi:MAG: hypothetical protein Kow00105_02430 [Phycisphaeraceae bacterium]